MKSCLPGSSPSIIRLVMLAGLLLAGSFLGTAQAVGGFDLLQSSAGTSVDLSALGLGVVPLHGVPILAALGNTDTIIHRTANIPPGGVVPVVVYALFLESNNHVIFHGQSADVYVTINNSGGQISTSVLPQPDALAPSNGTLTVRTNGTFDSHITVNADIIVVKAGASVTNPANYLGHQAAPPITLTSTNSTWTSTPPPGYPNAPGFPANGFYPRPIHTGPHPVVPAQCVSPGGTTSGATIVRTCISVQ